MSESAPCNGSFPALRRKRFWPAPVTAAPCVGVCRGGSWCGSSRAGAVLPGSLSPTASLAATCSPRCHTRTFGLVRGAQAVGDRAPAGVGRNRYSPAGPARHLVARIGANRTFAPIRVLPDGSHLAKPYRAGADQRRDGIAGRIVEYARDDPGRPGQGERHRLLTTLLDAELDPVTALVCLYRERGRRNRPSMSARPISGSVRCGAAKPRPERVQEACGLLLAHSGADVDARSRRHSGVGPAAAVVCRDPENPALPPARASGQPAPSPPVPPAGTGDCRGNARATVQLGHPSGHQMQDAQMAPEKVFASPRSPTN